MKKLVQKYCFYLKYANFDAQNFVVSFFLCNFAAAKLKMHMTNEQIKEELREITNTPAAQLTNEQKSRLREIAKTLGVNKKMKAGCDPCFHDLALRCFNALSKDEESECNEQKYVLKPNVDVFFGSIRVNAATLTDEMAKQILKRGFDKSFFAKCE